MVSDIQQLVNTAGVSNEYANAESKAIRELKRDFESAICSAQDQQLEAGAGSPYKPTYRQLFKMLPMMLVVHLLLKVSSIQFLNNSTQLTGCPVVSLL